MLCTQLTAGGGNATLSWDVLWLGAWSGVVSCATPGNGSEAKKTRTCSTKQGRGLHLDPQL